MSDKPVKFIDENGLRLDGRRVDEIRPMTVEMGVLSRADGSCYLEWGNNKVLAAVYGPRELHPRRLQRPSEALVRYRYNMAAFSVEDRIRPGPSRRSTEISKVSGEAFETVVMKQFYPGAVIDVFAEVLQADAGTRTAAINAATLALVDAGIPMKGLVAACAVGKVDGQLVIDLNKPEDNYGDADLPIAMTEDGEITLLQMDGNLTADEIAKGVEMVRKGCEQIFAIQKEALLSKFGTTDEMEILEEAELQAEVEKSGIVEDVEAVSDAEDEELEGEENEELELPDEEEAFTDDGEEDASDEAEDLFGEDVSEFEITENAESEDNSSSETEGNESDEDEGEKNE
ncbi:exosome complex exonuclease Rrp41 [Methanococcoides burtonii]|uniref:Exosome complex component Rrp41 n=1 Tax=Methanococcoides burtonii (strain DSM 6242 / NBRC 107633 / OCM 468 / ACE-M) TaxID=259564 RepID=Q12ZB7_METBU|nr:exosome complex exonuclease Rrp41 [Methanococcoides burtonii]ABE51209.1 Archaeal exosome complex RNA-binding protein [Methanococcoides burtonii DSM 6242]